MGTLNGKEEALEGAIVEGDTGFFSEENLRGRSFRTKGI
jgi:hypothetical protein